MGDAGSPYLRLVEGGLDALEAVGLQVLVQQQEQKLLTRLQSGRAVETRRHSHLQPSRAVWQGQERDQKAGPAGGSAAH